MSWAAANRAAQGRRERSYLVVSARPRSGQGRMPLTAVGGVCDHADAEARCDGSSGQGHLPLTAVRGVCDYADAEAQPTSQPNPRPTPRRPGARGCGINHLVQVAVPVELPVGHVPGEPHDLLAAELGDGVDE